MDGRRRGSGSMELPTTSHRRSQNERGSGEHSLAGSTKGMEDEWVSAVVLRDQSNHEAAQLPALRLYEKILYGMGMSFAFNALVVTNGTLIDYYEDTYKLDTSFLGLINFFTGMLTVFATIGFGVLSDSSPWTRFGRRKPYVAMLTPILAISVGLLYSPRLVSNTAYIPVWFAITFMVSQVATSALMVVIAAWGVALTREAEDRGGLFMVDAVLDLIGFLTGVLITSENAEKEGGIVLAVLFLVQNGLLLQFVPTEPAGAGNASAVVPFIPSLHLSLANAQFVCLLKAASWGSIVSSAVNLLPLFLQMVMGVAEKDVDEAYASYVRAVVAIAFFTIFAVQPLNRTLGRIRLFKLGILSGVAYGVLAFCLSFTDLWYFYLTVVPAGVFGGIVMVNGNVLLCNSIDYDELITGYRRHSFYQCLIYAPVTFFGVAGSSLPLSIISAIGNTDLDAEPSKQVVMVLRLWMTVCVSACLLASCYCLSGFRLTDEVQHAVCAQLQRREAGEAFTPTDPLEANAEESEGSPADDLEVVPAESSSEGGSFLDLYLLDTEVAQLLDKDGKRMCLTTFGINLVLMLLYTFFLIWRTVVAVNRGNATKAMLKSCLLMFTTLSLVYEACRLPAFLWVHRSVDRDLIKRLGKVAGVQQRLPFCPLMPAGAASLLIDEQKQADEESEGSAPTADSPMDGSSGAPMLTKAAAPQVVTPGFPPAFSVQLPPSQQANEQRAQQDMSPPQQQQQPAAAASRPVQQPCSQPSFQHDRVLRPPQATPTGRPAGRSFGSVQGEGPGAGERGADMRYGGAATVADRVVEELAVENETLRKSLSTLRKDYERTNMELKERIRALQLELEQDRSRIINQAVSGDYAKLREIRDALLEANRELPDVLPTKTLGQVTEAEVKQVLEASNFSVDHLQEAAAAIENCISDTSYDPFTRSENGKIISQNPDHEMLFPLSQQYGSAAAELVLIKKKELDRPDGATPRTMLWHDGRELSTVEAVRRLIESTVEARHASLLSGAGAGQRNGAACWEEWLGFQKGRVGTAPNEPKVFGDDVVEGYKAWVVRARQVSARTADMYLNDLNRVFRGCLRAMGQPHEVMDRQTLRDLCVERWELVGQEAANQKSKSVDQGLNYLKRYMRLDEDEIRATVDDEGLSASGSQVQALGEAVLEGFSVWLHENTSTRQSTWNGYGRAVEGLIADVLKSEEKEGAVLEADTVRDFVTQHREALEERGAADARPYVGAGVRYFLRFLGLIEPVDVEEDVVDKDEEEVHVSERKTEGEPRGMARLSAARASRRNSDRLPLNTELADQFAYYLVKQNGMKEGTAVEYIRYVGAWINDLVEMEGVDPPAAGSLDRASTMEFISGNEGAIRDYGRELKKAAKKGKVSAWRHFMIFMGLADADEDWITGSSLNKAPTASRPAKPSGKVSGPEASVRAAPMSGVLKASFSAFLTDEQGVAREEVDAYVSSATRSLTAILKAAKAKPSHPMESSEVRTLVEGHGEEVQQHLDALKKRPRAALRHLLAHVGAPLPSASESSSAPAGQTQGKGEEVVEAHKEGPLGAPLVGAFSAWLIGERPLTHTAARDTCKTVGSNLSQAYAEAGLAEEAHELANLQAARQFVEGTSPELKPALDAVQSVLKAAEAKDWALFKTFVEHEAEGASAGMAAAGGGGEEDVVGPQLMDEFAADAVEQGLSGQTAALQVLRVLSQGRRHGEAGHQEQLQTKEEVQHFLMPRQSAVRRILFHAPYHARPFECFLSFLGIEEAVLARFLTDDAGNGPAFNLSMGLCADLLLWLVEYRAMTIVQAEFVIRALGRLVAFLREAAPLQSEQKALGVSEVADLVTERRDEIIALVQAAADSRFKQAYSLFSLFHFKQDPMAAEHGPMRDSDEHREEEDDDDDDDMDDDDPWGLAGQKDASPGPAAGKKVGKHKGRVAVEPPSDFMSDSLKATLRDHVREELGTRQVLFPACDRLIFHDLGSLLPKGGAIKTKEELKKLILSHTSDVRALKSKSGPAGRAWKALLSFVDLAPIDLGTTRKPKTQSGKVSVSKPVIPRSAKQPTKKPAASSAPPADSGAAAVGVAKKALTVRFRKDFKRFMRTSDTGLSRDTRKFYSDLICEVLRVVLVRKGMKDTVLGAAEPAKEFVTQYAKEITQACDTFAKMSAWENFQVYVGLPKGSLGNVSNLSKEARDNKTAGTKKRPAKRGDEDDEEESSSGGGGRGGKGVKKRKRAEVHYAEDDDDDEMDGDDEVDMPASETDNDQSDGHRRAASRKRKRPELALDAKLATEFEAWLHATKGITSGTCYSGWVRQIVRKVYAMVGKPIKVVSLSNLPTFLEQYKKAIEAELALPRKDGRNSAWRHFLTYTGADKLVVGKPSKARGSTSESGEGGHKNWKRKSTDMSASDGDSD